MKKTLKKLSIFILVFGICLGMGTATFAKHSGSQGPGWDPPAPWSPGPGSK